MTIPMLQGWYDQIREPLQNISQGFGNIVNPNFQMQQLLKKGLIEDPTLRQKLIDAEAQNPGTIERMFGRQAAFLGQGMPSFEAQSATYAQQNATKPVEQWDKSAASEAAQVKMGLGTSLKREAERAQLDYWGIGRKQAQLDYDKAYSVYNATKDRLPEAARTEMEANLLQQQKIVQDWGVAQEAVKAYGQDREKMIDNLAKYLAGYKVDQKDVMPFEYQTALFNTDKGFATIVENRVRALQSSQEYLQRMNLMKFDKAQQEELLARQQANEFMKYAGELGMRDADPNAMYKVFKLGFTEAAKKKELEGPLKAVKDILAARGNMYAGGLVSAIGQQMIKLQNFNSAAKGAKSGDLRTEDIKTAIGAYNMLTQKAQEYSELTGKDLGIPELKLGNIEGFFKDTPILQYKAPVQANLGLQKMRADYLAGTLTKQEIERDTTLTPQEKATILGGR